MDESHMAATALWTNLACLACSIGKQMHVLWWDGVALYFLLLVSLFLFLII